MFYTPVQVIFKSKSKYLKALRHIASEPLWGETDNVDMQAAKNADEWDYEEHCYNPSSLTESVQLEAVVNLAREAIASTTLHS